MRLRTRDKRKVTVFAPEGPAEDVYLWGQGECIEAAVYPHGSGLKAAAYGERQAETRLLLYDGDKTLFVGMGVSLDGGLPAWRIVSLETWDHQRAVLEMIPEGRRGHADPNA